YTNHTVLPEALEKWSYDLFGRLLPRHLEIIQEIDRRLRARVEERYPGDHARLARMAIIANGEVRMASLAIAGSHTVNGVAALHTRILKDEIFRDFVDIWPERFTSVTNGVTQRRWMLHANPELSGLISGAIGDGWTTDLDRLVELEGFLDDVPFADRWQQIKRTKKKELARVVRELTGVELDPSMMFDVHVKRMHEYKRQLLNALRLVDLYL